MKGALWRAFAFIVSRRPVASYLIRRAQRTPYYPIYARDNPNLIYMDRHWLFNPYRKDAGGNQLPAHWPTLPSIRVHHICLPDTDQHEHDHPWLARTIILRGGYLEERREEYAGARLRLRGFTQAIAPTVCHRITEVSEHGAYTLFFTWGDSQGWGFKVDGHIVPWREYLGDPLSVPRTPLTATAQMLTCGSSVAPAQAEALARANFAHKAQSHGRQAA